ncbi:MAG: Gfo/Idh/MocA family oxidoreductase, partial [Proteobacteria bacterium]|nr:Gfo/Idh/MocA family oxidoreductase [Pseudomonadota bacterium]
MMEKSIAVIGAGYWGKNLVRNFHQIGALNVICDGDREIQSQMHKDYPDVCCTDNFDALLSDPSLAAMVIATPAVTHFALAAKALEAGKHVFVEKPLAVTYDEGRQLVDIARSAGKILFVGHILHYHPGVIALKKMVAEGKIGRLQYIYSRRLSLGKIRREENILWSFAPHDISLILSIVGEDPSYVDAVGSNFLHASIADVTMTNLKFPSGIGAHVFVSWLNPFKEQRLVVVGSQGMLVFDDTQPVDEKLILYPHTINWKNGLPIAEKAAAVTVGLSVQWEEPLKAECRAFIKAIATGQQPLTSGEEGLRVLHVLELSQKSMREKERAITPSTSVKTANSHLSKDVFVHETAIVDDGVRIGKGAKIWHFSHILSGSTLGEQCNIGQNVVIGPDVAIGDRCKIQNNVSVYKGVTLEDGVFCGPSMVFTNIYNPRAEISKMDQVRPTLVKKGATLGANSTIVCGHTIGSYAFVGAGAVITKDVPDHALMVGNPAKQMGWACVCGERLTKNL